MRKLFSLFIALLATTCLWAQRFQVGDLYYEYSEYSELPDVEPISGAVTIVWNPVGFVPCIENGSQLVLAGSHNGWGSELTKMDYFEAIDGAPGWYKVVVTGDYFACKPCALAPDGSFSWEYEWIDLPGAPCEILASSDPDVHLANGYEGPDIIIPNYSTPIVYICSWGFKNNPCPEDVGEIIGEVVVTSEFEGGSDKNYQNLSTAYIPETVVYRSKTYEVVGVDEYAFENSPVTSVTIPNSVKSIGRFAFSNCTNLASVNFGNSVTSIGDAAFWACSSLDTITCLAMTPPALGEDVFYGCDNPTLFVPCEALPDYQAHEQWGQFTTIECIASEETDTEDVIIESGTTTIQKIMRNGQLIILRDGVEYTIMGAQIQ